MKALKALQAVHSDETKINDGSSQQKSSMQSLHQMKQSIKKLDFKSFHTQNNV